MPSNTTSSVFFYTYVLESLKNGDEEDAKRREHYLKTTQAQYINFDNFQFSAKGGSQSCITGQGRRFLGLRLLEYKRRNKKAFGTGS